VKLNEIVLGLVLAVAVIGSNPLGQVLADAEPDGVTQASLAKDVVPILNQRCVMCHIAGAAQGGLDLYTKPRDAIVNVKSTESALNLVEPGDPEKSYLYFKLTGEQLTVGGSGAQMPFQAGQLDAPQLQLIRAWIQQGAQDN